MTRTRYMRPTGKTWAPTQIVVFAVEPQTRFRASRRDITEQTFGRVIAIVLRRRAGRWYASPPREFRNRWEWWGWFDSMATPKRRCYAIAPDAGTALTLLGAFKRMRPAAGTRLPPPDDLPDDAAVPDELPRLTLTRLILGTRPDIIQYTDGQRRWKVVGIGNYMPVPLDQLARDMGMDPSEGGDPDEPGLPARRELGTVVRICAAAVVRLVDWWLARDAGPWADTVAGLSVSLFRRHLVGPKILLHRDEDAARLERDGCHGGRASLWYVGDCGDRSQLPASAGRPAVASEYRLMVDSLVHLDYRSMYPFLLGTNPYPVRLCGIQRGLTPQEVGRMLKHRGIVATVTLDTKVPEYPMKRGNDIEFPIGRFTTTLAGPELETALADDSVAIVHEAAIYDVGRPFASVAQLLWRWRQEERAKGNKSGELFVKLMSNSLGGKMAQKPGRWVADASRPPEVEWGEFMDTTAGSGVITRYRSLGGYVERWEEGKVGGKAVAAAFSYLTAYGRIRMRRLRSLCPERTVILQDTDGLWVTRQGADALRDLGELDPEAFGGLREVHRSCYLRGFGAKHYHTEHGWTVAGIAGGFHVGEDGKFTDRKLINPMKFRPKSAPDHVIIRTQSVPLSLKLPAGGIDGEGWMRPLCVGRDTSA